LPAVQTPPPDVDSGVSKKGARTGSPVYLNSYNDATTAEPMAGVHKKKRQNALPLIRGLFFRQFTGNSLRVFVPQNDAPLKCPPTKIYFKQCARVPPRRPVGKHMFWRLAPWAGGGLVVTKRKIRVPFFHNLSRERGMRSRAPSHRDRGLNQPPGPPARTPLPPTQTA